MNFVNNNARLTCNIITTMYIKTDPVRKRPFDIIMDHYITLGFTITTLPMPHLPRWLVEFFRNIIAFFMFDISELISSPECEWEFSTVGIFMGKMTIPVIFMVVFFTWRKCGEKFGSVDRKKFRCCNPQQTQSLFFKIWVKTLFLLVILQIFSAWDCTKQEGCTRAVLDADCPSKTTVYDCGKFPDTCVWKDELITKCAFRDCHTLDMDPSILCNRDLDENYRVLFWTSMFVFLPIYCCAGGFVTCYEVHSAVDIDEGDIEKHEHPLHPVLIGKSIYYCDGCGHDSSFIAHTCKEPNCDFKFCQKCYDAAYNYNTKNTMDWFSDQYAKSFPLNHWEWIVLLRKFLNGWISLSLTNRLEVALPLQLTMCLLYLCLTIIFQPFQSNKQLEANEEGEEDDKTCFHGRRDRQCGRHNNIDITVTVGEMFLYIAGIMNNYMVSSFGGFIDTGGTNGTAVTKRRVSLTDMDKRFPDQNMACLILEWIGVSLMLITTVFGAYEASVDFTNNHKKSLEKIKGKVKSLVKIFPSLPHLKKNEGKDGKEKGDDPSALSEK